MIKTKRPQNCCKSCGYTWYPRGKNLSLRCPNCGHTGVKTIGASSAAIALVLWFAMSGNNNKSPHPASPTTDTHNIESATIDKQDYFDSPITTQPTSLDVTEEPAYETLISENNEPVIHDTTNQILPATSTQAPKMKKFYALVVKSDGQTETIELESTTPESAKIVIRDFRGNPEVLNGPSETIDW